MEKTDSLSKRPDWEVRVDKDNKDEMLVKLGWLEVRKMVKGYKRELHTGTNKTMLCQLPIVC